MARSSKRKRQLQTTNPAVRLLTPGRIATYACVIFLLGFTIVVAARKTPSGALSSSSPVTAPIVTKTKSLDDFLAMPADQLAAADIAEMNLSCSAGLPGAETLDVGHCLATLDAWALRVKAETERHFYRYSQKPQDYRNSPGYFRMLMLITVLQQDHSVHYNQRRIREVDFRNSKDLFIHGMIRDSNGGTCVSMPVLYTAVARQLGYPVKLVRTKAHLFCRWDSPEERFNIEGTSQGLSTHPDSHYKQWPFPVSEAEVNANHYLVSLTPGEELACFLAARGHCLQDIGRSREAFVAYTAASRLAPNDPAYRAWASQSKRHRPNNPQYVMRSPYHTHFPEVEPAKSTVNGQRSVQPTVVVQGAQRHQQWLPPAVNFEPGFDRNTQSAVPNNNPWKGMNP